MPRLLWRRLVLYLSTEVARMSSASIRFLNRWCQIHSLFTVPRKRNCGTGHRGLLPRQDQGSCCSLRGTSSWPPRTSPGRRLSQANPDSASLKKGACFGKERKKRKQLLQKGYRRSNLLLTIRHHDSSLICGTFHICCWQILTFKLIILWTPR